MTLKNDIKQFDFFLMNKKKIFFLLNNFYNRSHYKSIYKHILQLMIYQTFGHGGVEKKKIDTQFNFFTILFGIFIKLFFFILFNKKP